MEPQDEVFETLCTGLKAFDPVEVITWCGRLNILQTALPESTRNETLKRVLFADNPGAAVAALAEDRNNPEKWVYGINRMPLLELARWAAVLEGGTGQLREPPELRALVTAAQHAGQLSINRKFATHGPGFPQEPSEADALQLDLTMMRVLDAFRQEIPDRACLLPRAKRLGAVFFDSPWRTAFRDATGIEPEEYLACAFFLSELVRKTNDDGLPLSCFSTTDVVHGLGRIPKVLGKFLHWISQDPAQLRAGILRRALPAGAEIGPMLPFDTTPFRSKPLLRRPDGAWALVDCEFLDAKLWLGMFDLIGPGHSPAAVLGQFGKAVEKYVRRLLESIAARLPGGRKVKLIANPLEAGGREITDFALRDGNAVVLFEVKSSWVNESTFWSEGTQAYYELLTRKFAKTGAQQVGVTQLSQSIRRLSDGSAKPGQAEFFRCRRIYPVMVVQDEQLTDYRHEEALAEMFREHLQPDGPAKDGTGFMQMGELAVAPLVLMKLADLELLEERQLRRTLLELLEFVCREHPRREVPFSWMLQDSTEILQVRPRGNSEMSRARANMVADLNRRLRKSAVE